MTPARLIETLALEIAKAVADLKMPTEYHRTTDLRKVNIFAQYLPKEALEGEYFPLILIELLGLTDNVKSGSTATVGITIGTFAKEEDAWHDAFCLLEAVRRVVMTRRTIGQKFRLIDEVEYRTPEQQPAPFFFISGEAHYTQYLPQEIGVMG